MFELVTPMCSTYTIACELVKFIAENMKSTFNHMIVIVKQQSLAIAIVPTYNRTVLLQIWVLKAKNISDSCCLVYCVQVRIPYILKKCFSPTFIFLDSAL